MEQTAGNLAVRQKNTDMANKTHPAKLKIVTHIDKDGKICKTL